MCEEQDSNSDSVIRFGENNNILKKHIILVAELKKEIVNKIKYTNDQKLIAQSLSAAIIPYWQITGVDIRHQYDVLVNEDSFNEKQKYN